MYIKFIDSKKIQILKLMMEDINDVPRYSRDRFLVSYNISGSLLEEIYIKIGTMVQEEKLTINLTQTELNVLILLVIHHIAHSTDDWYPNVYNKTLAEIFDLLNNLLISRP